LGALSQLLGFCVHFSTLASVRGGHFLAGKMRPTLEVTITETASSFIRKKRADLGIALIDI
jgi:predicted DNA-binding protein with PD1-like motif